MIIRKEILLIVIGMMTLVTSCGGEDTPQLSYDDLYDELIMDYTSLDSLSDLTGESKSSLVDMRYGILDDDGRTAEVLNDVLVAFKENDQDKLKSIKEESKASKSDSSVSETVVQESQIAIKIKEVHDFAASMKQRQYLSDTDYNNDRQKLKQMQQEIDSYLRGIQQNKLEKFGDNLTVIISDYVNDELDKFIEDKYSLLNAIPNTWNFYTKSEEEFVSDFLQDFNASGLGDRCEKHYIERLNSFKNAVTEEQEIIFGKHVDIPDFNVIPGERAFVSDEILTNLIIERTKSQIKEISSDIFWDVIVTLIIAGIISWLIDCAIDSAKEEAINRFLKKMRWNSNDGFLKNAFRGALHAFGAYGEYEEEVNSIKARYGSYKWIANICVFMCSLIVTWFWFIKPQLKMESELRDELASKIVESSTTLNVNPIGAINRFISSSEEKTYDEDSESFADTVTMVQDTTVLVEDPIAIPDTVSTVIDVDVNN